VLFRSQLNTGNHQLALASASDRTDFSFLQSSLEWYSEAESGQTGKEFEGVICSFLFFLLNSTLKSTVSSNLLNQLVQKAGITRSNLAEGHVILRSDVDSFPCQFEPHKQTVSPGWSSSLDGLLRQQESKNKPCAAAVIWPKAKYNLASDVVVVLRTKTSVSPSPEFVILSCQCKDWFKGKSGSKSLINHWRWSQQFLRYDTVQKMKQSTSANVSNTEVMAWLAKENAKVVHVLFTSNRVDNDCLNPKDGDCVLLDQHGELTNGQLNDDEMIISFDELKKYCPTVGLNAAVAHKLRSVFVRNPDSDDLE